MLKYLAALLVALPVAAQAFTKCDLTDIGGPGAKIAGEASNPVVSGPTAFAAFAQGNKVQVLVAQNGGATLTPLQTVSDQSRPVSSVRLAAAGNYLYVTWIQGSGKSTHLWMIVNRKRGDPGGWGKRVDLGETQHFLQQISADGNSVSIAYVRADGHTGVLSSSDTGRTFKPAVDLGEGDGEIVIASLGQDVYVAWEFGRQSDHPSIDFAASHDNGATFTVKNISDNGTRHAHEPIFSLNQSSGRLSLVWREELPEIAVYLQSSDRGSTWSTPLTIDTMSRQVMVQDTGDRVYVSYLKDYTINSTRDWQVQLAISSDSGHSFPEIHNLSGPSGISTIVGDNSRPVPWAGGGEIRLTGVLVDGVRIWSGRGGQLNPNAVYLGLGNLAATQGNVALWQAPEGVETFAYCHQ
jgi:hypothetical protein